MLPRLEQLLRKVGPLMVSALLATLSSTTALAEEAAWTKLGAFQDSFDCEAHGEYGFLSVRWDRYECRSIYDGRGAHRVELWVPRRQRGPTDPGLAERSHSLRAQ